MGDNEVIIKGLNDKFDAAAGVDVNHGNFDVFRKKAHKALEQLYRDRNDFLDSSSDKKFADFLKKKWPSIKKSGKMSAVELHGLIDKLMDGLPWGGLASVFTGSVLKNLKSGFSKLASKASGFVKEFENHTKNVAKRKKKLDKLVDNVGKYLSSAKSEKEIEYVRDQIVDVVYDVRRICGKEYSECIDGDDKKVWEGLGTWAEKAEKVVDDADGNKLVELLEECKKTIGDNSEFVYGKQVGLVIRNLESLIKSGNK